MLRVDFRLCFVKPKAIYAIVYVVFLEPLPHICSRFRIRWVNLRLRAIEIKHPVGAAHCANQHIVLQHMAVIFTVFVDGGPHRNHKLHAHVVELFRHLFGIRPVFGVEFVIALLCPMEIVDHDNGKRNSQLFIFSGYLQKLILGFIPQLALPETCGPFRHLRSVPGKISQKPGYLFGAAAHDHVIHLPGAVACPPGAVPGQLTAAGGRLIPQKAVS